MSRYPCSYVTLSVVPHPHTGAGRAVGVLLHSRPAEYLGLRVISEVERLREVAPDVDVELLARYLASCAAIVDGDATAGELALMSRPERFHWLAAPRSDVLQPSRVEHVTAENPEQLLEQLFRDRVLSAAHPLP